MRRADGGTGGNAPHSSRCTRLQSCCRAHLGELGLGALGAPKHESGDLVVEKGLQGFFTVVAPNVPPLHRNLLGVGLRQCDGGETFFSLTVVMLCDMTPPRKLAADRTRRAALAPAALLARRRDSDFARCSLLFLFERQRLPVPRVQRRLLLLHRFPLCQWVLES